MAWGGDLTEVTEMEDDLHSPRVNELFLRMAQGSKQAFSEFYDAYADLVLRVSLNMMRDPLEAEDVCHDVFLEVYQKPDSYDPGRGSVEAWLAVKTRSRCLDRLRKKRPLSIANLERVISKQEQSPSAEELVMKRSEQEIIGKAMRDLPHEQSDVLQRAYYHERTHRELSAELQLPLGTIKSRIRYGLHNLKKQLSILGWAHSGQGGEHHES